MQRPSAGLWEFARKSPKSSSEMPSMAGDGSDKSRQQKLKLGRMTRSGAQANSCGRFFKPV
jgi:hypothetical protein